MIVSPTDCRSCATHPAGVRVLIKRTWKKRHTAKTMRPDKLGLVTLSCGIRRRAERLYRLR